MNTAGHGDRRTEVEKLAVQLAHLLAAATVEERPSLEACFARALREALAQADGDVPAQYRGLKSPPLTPELQEWLRRQFTAEEIAAWLREFKEKGGLELHEFLPELEEIVGQP